MNTDSDFPAQVLVDTDNLEHNYRVLQSRAPHSQIMAVVKANAYGHGLEQTSEAAFEMGMRWFGVSKLSEAVQLRRYFDQIGIPRDDARIFTWIAQPGQSWRAAVEMDLTVSASSVEVLEELVAAAELSDHTLPVHLKVDVGMSRAGAIGAQYEELVRSAAKAAATGRIEVEGIWSHLSCADDPSQPGLAQTEKQIDRFEWAKEVAQSSRLEPSQYHLGATSAALWHPRAHNTMVRCGIGLYGLSPNPANETEEQIGFRPALTLSSRLTSVKLLPAGEPVSYGGTWKADCDHWIGLVPIGYADGIDRAASNPGSAALAKVAVHTSGGVIEAPVIGRICMDQFIIDLGADRHQPAFFGDEVTVIGGIDNVTSANSWANATRTINYEVIARLSSSIPRKYVGGKSDAKGR